MSDSEDSFGWDVDSSKPKEVHSELSSCSGDEADHNTKAEKRKAISQDTSVTPKKKKISQSTTVQDSAEETFENHADRITKYLNKLTDYNPISMHVDKDVTIDSDDEIWIVKCPNDISVENLVSKELKFKSKSKIKIAGTRYDCNFDEDSTFHLTLAPKYRPKAKFSLKNIKDQGTFVIKPKIPKISLNENKIVPQAKAFIPLPETKRRHPFFGVDYDKNVKLPTEVYERLHPNNSACNKPKKVKKEKRKQEIISEDETRERKKKSKKRKLSQIEQGTTAKKVKKEERSQVDDWGSERNIEENLFNC